MDHATLLTTLEIYLKLGCVYFTLSAFMSGVRSRQIQPRDAIDALIFPASLANVVGLVLISVIEIIRERNHRMDSRT